MPLIRNIYMYNTDARSRVMSITATKMFRPGSARDGHTHMQIFDVRLHRLQLLPNVRGRLLAAAGMMGRGGRGGGRAGSVPALQVRGKDHLLRHGVLPQGEDADEATAKENEIPLKWSVFCGKSVYFLCYVKCHLGFLIPHLRRILAMDSSLLSRSWAEKRRTVLG